MSLHAGRAARRLQAQDAVVTGTMNRSCRMGRRAWLGACGASGLALACGKTSRKADEERIRVWAHQGQEAENRAVRAAAEAFERAHSELGLQVELSFFPDFHYTEKLSIAAAAGDMPDAFELDGPLVASFVDAGLLAPLDGAWDAGELADFLPTILQQGTVAGRLYALGAFESALVLYHDGELLERARVSPRAEQGFSWSELLEACGRLAALGVRPLALHMNESADEWFTYAFSPLIWSGGGALIAPHGRDVRGVLASPANVASLLAWQELFRRGYALTDPRDPDPFGAGSVAMDWSGHWMARSHLAAKGARLGAMPLPRTGARSVAPCGSYCWALSVGARGAAVRWLRWITDPAHGVLPLVRANGAVPARRSTFAHLPQYREVPYALFRRQLEQSARPRPRTPFYALLTRQFASALRDIARGAEVERALLRAEGELSRTIERRLRSKQRRGA